MEKLHYYVLIDYYQYEPRTDFQALYAHKENLNFNIVCTEIRNELEKNYPYSSYDEEKNGDYGEFVDQKFEEALKKRGFIELDADVTTIGQDDKYDTFEIW